MPLAGRNRRRWSLSAVRPVGDMAIDLGTANTVVYVRGRGIVLSEPSVVAIDQQTNEVHAVGADAQRMIGRTPASISADRPLRHGVIADFDVCEAMLRQFVDKVLTSRFSRPRLIMCAPSGITDVERRAVEEAARSAGAREVHLIEESLAAAIGSGLEIAEPVGRMVVDVGGGTTEVAVISLGSIVVARSLRTGGYDLDDAISTHLRLEHRMAIGTQSAEQIKLAIASAEPLPQELRTRIRGRDLMSASRARSSSTRSRSAPRSSPRSPRSARRSTTRSRRRRPSWPPTSPRRASCSPAAARCCAGWSTACTSRPACRCGWPRRR